MLPETVMCGRPYISLVYLLIPWHRLFSIGISLGTQLLNNELDYPVKYSALTHSVGGHLCGSVHKLRSFEIPPEEAAPDYTDNCVLLPSLC